MKKLTCDKLLAALSAAVCLSWPAWSKTVALWPLECDDVDSADGGICAVSAANDLTVANAAGSLDAVLDGPGWNLPPNPDKTEGLRFSPVNHSVVRSTVSFPHIFSNASVAGQYLRPSQKFTLEGWFRIESLPGNGNFYAIAMAFGPADENRFLLTLRNNSGGYTSTTDPGDGEWISFQVWSGRPFIGECVFWKPKGDDLAAVTAGWHHFALTHHPNLGGRAEWKFYTDGILRGTKTCDGVGTDASVSAPLLTLNGRAAGNAFKGSLDYIRISDEVLEPSEFLCAGGAGTISPRPQNRDANTLVYWPLGRTPQGGIDGSPAVGTAFIGGGDIDGRIAGQDSKMRANETCCEDCAFAGSVPNAATSLKPAAANGGSLFIPKRVTDGVVEIQKLGLQVSLTNDFTVEGWYKYERRDPVECDTWHYLCGALNGCGWKLQQYILNNTTYYSLHVGLDNDVRIHSEAGANLGAVEPGKWVHLALVYDADGYDGSRGVWRFYKDGVLSGSIYNTQTIPAGQHYPSAFYIGASQSSGLNGAFGKFDTWRVSRAALSPDQFLCATTGARDATDVLALWPLDAKRGVYVDGTDLTGAYTFETPRADTYCAAASTDTPPQADLDPQGGSVAFGGVDGAGGRSCMFSTDPEVCRLFQTDAWTYECWMKCTNPDANWMIVFWPNDTAVSDKANPSGCISLSYRPKQSGGFVLWNNNMVAGTADAVFKGSDGQPISIGKDTWTHVALEFQKLGTTGQWSLFTNGVLAATLSGAFGKYPNITNVLIGGRPGSDNSFNGRMACMRLSKTALDPKDFLCSRPAQAERTTVGFWPLDSVGGTLDLANRVGWISQFQPTAAVGEDDRARSVVPRPDASAEFRGNRRQNVGSVGLGAGGRLRTSLGGSDYAYGRFTVEGWMKWNSAGGSGSVAVVGNWAGSVNSGWRLSLDTTVSPAKFRICAKDKLPATRFIDARFEAGVEPNVWHHVALGYDPTKGFGMWSLRIDGEDVGSVANEWRPNLQRSWSDALCLGAAAGENGVVSFVGGLDMWRVSVGLLGAEELLWALPRINTIFIR